jgi:hypothetical protein
MRTIDAATQYRASPAAKRDAIHLALFADGRSVQNADFATKVQRYLREPTDLAIFSNTNHAKSIYFA